ncbi:subtilisin-like protease SBT2.5 [Solanum stenotomum]|uniref:subtilisin-like protease SBT2.5 n=1 Tax=Solanum stenotomum TaxID=172797 RepID=UPI0020D1F016|nr:subtilisin-like protease SBT2.5 [Solanum stenotomum]
MATILTFIALSFMTTWVPLLANAKIFIVLMKDDPFVSTKSKNFEDIDIYKERMRRQHDVLLGSLLEKSVYTKLYSYTHLINGFAIHLTSDEALDILKNVEGVRAIYEDVKMKKLTTHTPDFLGLPAGVWPKLGGPTTSGAGVVIGMIDTGINPFHPSFLAQASNGAGRGTIVKSGKFKGKCVTGDRFPETACNSKIVGAQYFARAATAAGEFNASRDYASPFDADGHGSHTASTAAGNHQVPVIVNHFNYGYASGMAPGAGIAVYKAMYSFGGFMSDVVAAVDQAVEDGVDILSLSVGPASVPTGPSAFLNVLEMQLLFATRAGVLVVQAAGNGGPSSTSILSFSPWITSVAASTTDRRYNNSIVLGNGQSFSGSGLSPPTLSEVRFPLAAASDVCKGNTSSALLTVESCQETEPFIRTLVQGKIVICTYTFDFESEAASIATVADTIQKVGAAGFVLTMDPDISSEKIKGATMTLSVPGLILNSMEASTALREYYNSNTLRSRSGRAISFRATAKILDGRQASYNSQDPVVASYSSRGPDVNNALLDTADVLKPNIMAPGSSIWASWSPNSEGDQYIKGQNFALLSGTSMATPHIAGIAALIKQKHPGWSPAAITSAMMTAADVTNGYSSTPILAQQTNQLTPATPFDFGAGLVNPSRAIDPGLIFKATFKHYVLFLCSVPGVDEMSVRRAVGVGCPSKKKAWCSDLNTPSVTISNLVGSRNVIRRVTNVAGVDETYQVIVQEPLGVSVSVRPRVFNIIAKASKHITFVLNATQTTNTYSFGEIVFQGNQNHTVRVPLAVFVSSTLHS